MKDETKEHGERTCAACKHGQPCIGCLMDDGEPGEYCHRPGSGRSCNEERADGEGLCGPAARFWEAK
jgi:hypothetical protein